MVDDRAEQARRDQAVDQAAGHSARPARISGFAVDLWWPARPHQAGGRGVAPLIGPAGGG